MSSLFYNLAYVTKHYMHTVVMFMYVHIIYVRSYIHILLSNDIRSLYKNVLLLHVHARVSME